MMEISAQTKGNITACLLLQLPRAEEDGGRLMYGFVVRCHAHSNLEADVAEPVVSPR